MNNAIYQLDGIDLRTPLKLRRRRKGDFVVVPSDLPAGKSVTVVTMRNAIYAGLKPHQIVPDRPMRVHKLLSGGMTVTSDVPMELYSQSIAFKQVRGRVLVGGLGLGMASTLIANLPVVTEVVTVELSQDVIGIVWHQLPKTRAIMKIERADLFKYIARAAARRETFGAAYFDIWSGTGEASWADYIVPLRRLMYKHFPETPVSCWLEDEMIGQVVHGLQQAVNLPGGMAEAVNAARQDAAKRQGMTDADFERVKLEWIYAFKPYAVFYRAFEALPEINNWRADPRKFIGLYTRHVGEPLWEQFFGRLWTDWKEPKRVKLCNVREGA
jgi:hypothetical protein